jgi:hypothetical protein
VQIEEGGAFPRSIQVFSSERAELNFYFPEGTGPRIIRDENGDGIPDLKVEGGRRYRIGKIEWIPDDGGPSIEQIVGDNPIYAPGDER